MSLRNKKTGKIIDGCFVVCEYNDGERFSVKDKPVFDSLAELNEEWEDYQPKEPRINDEDARDAVYSWASKLQIHQVKCKIAIRGLGVVVTTFRACSLHSEPIIEFTSLDANVANGARYTIAELCGEEEE